MNGSYSRAADIRRTSHFMLNHRPADFAVRAERPKYAMLRGFSATLFVLFSAPAGAWIVPADTRAAAGRWLLRHHLAVDEVPAAVEPFEFGAFVMLLHDAVHREPGAEFDDAFFIRGAAALLGDDVEPVPRRSLRPRFGRFPIDAFPMRRMNRVVKVVDVALHVGRVARSHERFGGRGAHLSFEDGTATCFGGFTDSANARHSVFSRF